MSSRETLPFPFQGSCPHPGIKTWFPEAPALVGGFFTWETTVN